MIRATLMDTKLLQYTNVNFYFFTTEKDSKLSFKQFVNDSNKLDRKRVKHLWPP